MSNSSTGEVFSGFSAWKARQCLRLAFTFIALGLVLGTSGMVRAIVGGATIPAAQLAPGGTFEWLVRLEGPGGRCTGSLIAADWVLTAGHCRTATLALIGDDSVGVPVVETVVHPSFNSGQPNFDAALLRIATPSVIRPVSRPVASLVISTETTLTLAGWGIANFGGAPVSEPRAGVSTVTSVNSQLLTTGTPTVGCAGDSGGPMLYRGTLAGVISSADAACSAFTVGARFRSIADWVTSIAGPGSANRPPVVRSGELTVVLGSTFGIPYEFSDPDGATLTLDAVVAVNDGLLEHLGCDALAPPTVCNFRAPADFVGDTVATYTVSDGQATTTATWTIHVQPDPTPTAPIASDSFDQSWSGFARSLVLDAFDANADALVYTIVTPPGNGSVSCLGKTCSYTSNPGFLGLDTFTWTASDGVFLSNTGTATIRMVVGPRDQTLTTIGQEPLEQFQLITYNGFYLGVLSTTTHGVLDCPPAESPPDNTSTIRCTYRAAEGFVGVDSFTWQVAGMDNGIVVLTVTINVEPPLHIITVTKTGNGSGTVTSTPAGINCGATCNANFVSGSMVTLMATPNAGSTFTGWSGACSGTGTCSVTMDAAKTVTANFALTTFNLIMSRNGEGQGDMIITPGNITCTPTCSIDIAAGSVITITPSPAPKSVHSGYAGCPQIGVITGPCTFTMDGNKNIAVFFNRSEIDITIVKTGAGNGTVSSSLAGLDCGASCTVRVPISTPTITFNPGIPGAGSLFSGFSGANCSGTGACTVSLGIDRTIYARFDLEAPTFTVTTTAAGGAGSLASILGTIFDAGNNVCLPGTKTISFNIPAATDLNCNPATGICVVQIPDTLDIRCGNIVIDGYTQPGAAPNSATDDTNNAKIKIELGGASSGTSARAVAIGRAHTHPFGSHTANNVTLRGLAFPRHRLEINAGNSGSVIFGDGSGHVVSGNVFGWHADGTRATGIVSLWMRITGAFLSSLQIGGPNPADRNRFTNGDAESAGIFAEGVTTSTFEGNYVNIDSAGNPVVSNGFASGISVSGGPSGGTPNSTNNVIRRNVLANINGTPISTGGGIGNTVTENIAFGHSLNQPGIGAGGSNPQQPPMVGAVVVSATQTRVSGTVTGNAGGTIRLEFFDAGVAYSSNNGRAVDFLAFVDVVMDGSGQGSFNTTLPLNVLHVSVTATRLSTGDTSQFSQYVASVVENSVLTVTKSGPGALFNVSSTPTGINCGATCSADFAGGTVVTLAVIAIGPHPGIEFNGWSGACTGTGACTVTMDAAKTVTANFAEIDNIAPIAIIEGPTTGRSVSPVTLSGAASVDIGSGIVEYRWSRGSFPRSSNTLPNTITTTTPIFSYTPDRAGRFEVELVVVDAAGNFSAPYRFATFVSDIDAPIAMLTVTPVPAYVGEAVQLAGTANDVGGSGIRQIVFRFVEIPADRPRSLGAISPISTAASITRQVPGTFSPMFTPDWPGMWRVQMQAIDTRGNSSTSEVVEMPVLVRGQVVAVIDSPTAGKINSPIVLDGALSARAAANRPIVSYRWEVVIKPRGSRLSSAQVTRASPQTTFEFVADTLGLFYVELVVTDSSGTTSQRTAVKIRISDTDAPVAVLNATPDPVFEADKVTLDGTESFDVGGSGISQLVYKFIKTPTDRPRTLGGISDIPVAIQPYFVSNGATLEDAARDFRADWPGMWRVQLVATDYVGLVSVADEIAIPVFRSGEATAIIEGKSTGLAGSAAAFSGGLSRGVGGQPIVRYEASLVQNPRTSQLPGPISISSNKEFTFTPDTSGRYVVGLVVEDALGRRSQLAEHSVLVSAGLPVAELNATPSPATAGSAITLSGENSFDLADSSQHIYKFSVVERPAGSTAFDSEVSSSSPTLTFVPDKPGVWRFRLIYAESQFRGGSRSSLPDEVAVAVFPGAPDAPTNLVATPNASSASIAFDAANDNGAAITAYAATCTASSAPALTVSGPRSPIVVAGLINGTVYACSVQASNARGTGPASASVSVTPRPDLVLEGVVSRKTHGAAGTFDLPISTTPLIGGSVTTESRIVARTGTPATGYQHDIVFRFNAPVLAIGSITVLDRNDAPVGSATVGLSGDEVTVSLSGIKDLTRLTIRVNDVNGKLDVAASMGFLFGDANNSRSVNSSDISGVKTKSGQSANLLNFRFDVNASGAINSSDISVVKARSGLVLP